MIGRMVAVLLATPALVLGADVWVIRGLGITPAEPCFPILWDAYAVVHNMTSANATVQLVHASNSVYDGPPISAVIPAQRSILARHLNVSGPGALPLWVDHLDVPDGVTVESRLEQLREDLCAAMGQPPVRRAIGKVRMPIFKRLTSAGETQFHYGTDLGSVRSRLNVAVYNASAMSASAVIQLTHPLCTGAPSREPVRVTIPADTIIQIGLGEVVAPCADADRKDWVSVVTVTVDQPSLSVVSTLSNELPVVNAAVTAH